MLKEFEVKTFKKFPDIKLQNLSDINIILGKNNVGKTTLLEALFGFACGDNLLPLLSRSIIRGNDFTGVYELTERVLNSFYNKNTSPFTFSFRGIDESGNVHSYEHKLVPSRIFSDLNPQLMGSSFTNNNPSMIQQSQQITNGGIFSQTIPQTAIGKWEISKNGKRILTKDINFPMVFSNENHLHQVKYGTPGRLVDILSHRAENDRRQIYALLKRENIMNNFVSEIAKSFEDIHGFDMLPYPDGTTGPVSVSTDRGLIPLASFGDGMQRFFHIIGGLFLYRNGIHCIEEVDATFHHEAQESFSTNLLLFTRLTNNQVFMTSHSSEFVDNFLTSVSNRVGESGLERIRVLTLRNTSDNSVRVRTLTGTEALIRRNEYEMELR